MKNKKVERINITEYINKNNKLSIDENFSEALILLSEIENHIDLIRENYHNIKLNRKLVVELNGICNDFYEYMLYAIQNCIDRYWE